MTRLQDKFALVFLLVVVAMDMTTLPGPAKAQSMVPSPPRSEVVEVAVIVAPKGKKPVPEGSRVVIADVEGECADELKAALTRRLIDTEGYDVLSRDNLEQILVEADKTWAGRFNTQTAVRLGELMGASLFVVGRVLYCGPLVTNASDEDSQTQLGILSALQIIDLATGKLILSSANQGTYTPRPLPRLFSRGQEQKASGSKPPAESPGRADERSAPQESQTKGGIVARSKQALKKLTNVVPAKAIMDELQPSETKRTHRETEEQYAILKAAEDLANGFADEFFARPLWEKVEMWTSSRWGYGQSVRFVRLGRCADAVSFLEGISHNEIPAMGDVDTAKYLHNYGVALLCANDPDKSILKLQSAYRIYNNQATLKMLGLAARIKEWALHVEPDTQPEVDILLQKESAAAPQSGEPAEQSSR